MTGAPLLGYQRWRLLGLRLGLGLALGVQAVVRVTRRALAVLRLAFATAPPGRYRVRALADVELASGEVELLPGRVAWVELAQ